MDELLTFEVLLEKYFYAKTLRPDTQWSYCKVVRTFTKFAKVLPGEVSADLVLRWKEEVLKVQGLKVRTWNNKVAHMRALFNFAIKKNYSRKRTRLMALWLARALNVKKHFLTVSLKRSIGLCSSRGEGSNPAIVIVMHWLQHGSGLPCWISCAIRPYARISSYISELAMSILIRTAFTYGLRG